MTRGGRLAAGTAIALLLVGCGGASSLPIEGSSGNGGRPVGGGTGGRGTGGGLGAGGLGGSGTGGGGDRLVGTWEASFDVQGTVAEETITFQSDGKAIETATVTSVSGASCTGTLQFTGVAWAATATTITIDEEGAPCTGGYACSNGISGTCTTSPLLTTTCEYTLSNGDSTLVLECPNATSLTFTRTG